MFKTVNIEMSLKPFKRTDDRYIREICKRVFEQWRPLLKNRSTVSVMLWTADGSEILDYAGDLEQEFEWCCYIGTANHELIGENDDPNCSLHDKKQLYMKNPPVMTYKILRKIVAILKEEGKKAFPNAAIRVGETFDIGPEFAISDFKYKWHFEISSGAKTDSFGFVDATALLNADSRRYAAYPDGIPENTQFGTFFGKQADIFLRDMGFDYLWLSNGLGFSANPWDITGKVFDGKGFHLEKLETTRRDVFEFWRLFRKECPNFPVETRGTNNSVGIDYATDGVPLYDIYNAGFNITPPPNSPWAAINDNFGLEIMGHMTRICELPSNEFMFRYYIHDPWWLNSPWYDRYNGNAQDIYLPMAVSRINPDGKVQSAEIFNILSIDNSYGNMPDNCVNEPLPHILKAEKDIADGIAPLVWVYPMREFTASHSEDTLYEMYYGDNYISEAINNGLPLNCVASTDIFLKTTLELYERSILISPIPQTKEIADRLTEFENAGGNVIYYGSDKAAKRLKSRKNFIDFKSSPSALREKLADFGYSIRFELKSDDVKPNAITIARVENSLCFSVYSPNLTTDTYLKLPLGAPILTGTDAEIRGGYAVYRFGMSEHRECRVFVKQENGVVTLKELAPVSTNYHRKLKLGGLKNATVYIFPESAGNAALGDVHCSEDKISGLMPLERVEDRKNGVYFKAENLSGTYTVLFPTKKPSADLIQSESENELSCYRRELYLEPIWRGYKVYHEPVFFYGGRDTAKLLYPINKIVSVRSYDLKTVYIAGRDYEITADGLLKRLEGSRIPVYTSAIEKIPETEIERDFPTAADNSKSLAFIKDTVYPLFAVDVTYEHTDCWQGNDGYNPYPLTSQTDKLRRVIKKLEAGEKVNVLFFGDSISCGWSSSGLNAVNEIFDSSDTAGNYVKNYVINTAPYAPSWMDMVIDGLCARYPKSNITSKNLSLGGQDSNWGKNHISARLRLLGEWKPDLIIMSFGCNDIFGGKIKGADFENNIQEIINILRRPTAVNGNPDAEVLLWSQNLPNLKCIRWRKEVFLDFESRLEKISNNSNGVALTKNTSAFAEIVKSKEAVDYLNTNVNHGNDFTARMIAQAVLAALTPDGKPNISI